MKNTTIPCYELYQGLIDRIFGKDVIRIKNAVDNNIIGTLKYNDQYLEFKRNFEARLIRLRDKYSNSNKESYNDLLKTISLVADSKNWQGAYAELVAYDIMHNGYQISDIELNQTLSKTDSFVGEMGGEKTNEDGYISEYDFYFDVKILADTTGKILKGIITDAVNQVQIGTHCNIIPEYALDDYEQDYQNNRQKIFDELKDYLEKNKPSIFPKKQLLISKVIANLSFHILWGSGINSSMGEYNPYRNAEKCKHLIIKRYTKKFMKQKPFFLVMINFPWYNGLINDFVNADGVFYRSLARRTFCEYKNLPTLMKSIVPQYKGTETVFEVSNHLSGIIFIDDHSIKNNTYSCHIYLNPNAKNKIPNISWSYLESLVSNGDKNSVLDDMENDNY